MANRLIELMPDAVSSELNVAGSAYELRAGRAVPVEELSGGYLFVVEQGVVSKFVRTDQGRISEVGMVGFEGIFPIAGLMRVTCAPHLVVSQVGPVQARRIRAREFHAIVDESPEAARLVRHYCYAFMVQVGSNIAVSEHNPGAQRLARWLLMCHDRVDGDVIPITHETLGQMICAYRPTVTAMLHDLREEGIIAIARGEIEIRSRARLYDLADGAYGMFERYWNNYLGPFGKPTNELDDCGPVAALSTNGRGHVAIPALRRT